MVKTKTQIKMPQNSTIKTVPFFNRSFDKKRLKLLFSWYYANKGEIAAFSLVENLQKLGFTYAMKAGISLGVDDLKVPPNKSESLTEAIDSLNTTKDSVQSGNVTALEEFQQFVDTWHRTSENLKTAVVVNFTKNFKSIKNLSTNQFQKTESKSSSLDPKVIKIPLLSQSSKRIYKPEIKCFSYYPRILVPVLATLSKGPQGVTTYQKTEQIVSTKPLAWSSSEDLAWPYLRRGGLGSLWERPCFASLGDFVATKTKWPCAAWRQRRHQGPSLALLSTSTPGASGALSQRGGYDLRSKPVLRQRRTPLLRTASKAFGLAPSLHSTAQAHGPSALAAGHNPLLGAFGTTWPLSLLRSFGFESLFAVRSKHRGIHGPLAFTRGHNPLLAKHGQVVSLAPRKGDAEGGPEGPPWSIPLGSWGCQSRGALGVKSFPCYANQEGSPKVPLRPKVYPLSINKKKETVFKNSQIKAWSQTLPFLENSNVVSVSRSYGNTLNPVYMMAFSGARGNLSQVRQLVGMRGLMADPQGQLVEFPIQSNFREGLTVTEYMISCYGARKGIVDTALRTAAAGYLTRRLVDVSHHQIVRFVTCGTKDGILLSLQTKDKKQENSEKNLPSAWRVPIKSSTSSNFDTARLLKNQRFANNVSVKSWSKFTGPQLSDKVATKTKPFLVPEAPLVRPERPTPEFKGQPQNAYGLVRRGPEGITTRPNLVNDALKKKKPLNFCIGRVLARDIPGIAFRNQEVDISLGSSNALREIYETIGVSVRSPLTCKAETGVCQLCYGWSVSANRLVGLGEAVGIIAAQSIGEPGTQLTMRTFHTGGVFSGDIMEECRAKHEGVIYFHGVYLGLMVRTAGGAVAFCMKTSGVLTIHGLNKATTYTFLPNTLLFVRQGERVFTETLLAQIPNLPEIEEASGESTKTIVSSFSGEVRQTNIINRELENIRILSGQKDAPLYLPNQTNELSLLSRSSWPGQTKGPSGDSGMKKGHQNHHLGQKPIHFASEKQNSTHLLELFENKRYLVPYALLGFERVGGSPLDSDEGGQALLAQHNALRHGSAGAKGTKNLQAKPCSGESDGQWSPTRQSRLVLLAQGSKQGLKSNGATCSAGGALLAPLAVRSKGSKGSTGAKQAKLQIQRGGVMSKKGAKPKNLAKKFSGSHRFGSSRQHFLYNKIAGDFLNTNQVAGAGASKISVYNANKTNILVKLRCTQYYRNQSEQFSQVGSSTANDIVSQVQFAKNKLISPTFAPAFKNSSLLLIAENIPKIKNSKKNKLKYSTLSSNLSDISTGENTEGCDLFYSNAFDKEGTEKNKNAFLFYPIKKSVQQLSNKEKRTSNLLPSKALIATQAQALLAKPPACYAKARSPAESQLGSWWERPCFARLGDKGATKTKWPFGPSLALVVPKALRSTGALGASEALLQSTTSLSFQEGPPKSEVMPRIGLKASVLPFASKLDLPLSVGSKSQLSTRKKTYNTLHISDDFNTKKSQQNRYQDQTHFTRTPRAWSYRPKGFELAEHISSLFNDFHYSHKSSLVSNNQILSLNVSTGLLYFILNQRSKTNIFTFDNLLKNKINFFDVQMYKGLNPLLDFLKLLHMQRYAHWFWKLSVLLFVQSNAKNLKVPSKSLLLEKEMSSISLQVLKLKNHNLSKKLIILKNLHWLGRAEGEGTKPVLPYASKAPSKAHGLLDLTSGASGTKTGYQSRHQGRSNDQSHVVPKAPRSRHQLWDQEGSWDTGEAETRPLSAGRKTLLEPLEELSALRSEGSRPEGSKSYLIGFSTNLRQSKKIRQGFRLKTNTDKRIIEFAALTRLMCSRFSNQKFVKTTDCTTLVAQRAKHSLSSESLIQLHQNKAFRNLSESAFQKSGEIFPIQGSTNLRDFYKSYSDPNNRLILTHIDRISFKIGAKNNPVVFRNSTSWANTQLSSYGPQIGSFINIGDEVIKSFGSPSPGQIIEKSRSHLTLRRTQNILYSNIRSRPAKVSKDVKNGNWLGKGTPLVTLPYLTNVTGDIVAGIPKIEQLFEARGEALYETIDKIWFFYKTSMVPLSKAVRECLKEIGLLIVSAIQKVYSSQGVHIADKHLEVIVRQMTRRAIIVNPGDTSFLPDEFIDLQIIERVNWSTYGENASYRPCLIGITKASLTSNSFLSSASFQQTARVLERETFLEKTDRLLGLKERVMMGAIIYAGTGDLNTNVRLPREQKAGKSLGRQSFKDIGFFSRRKIQLT